MLRIGFVVNPIAGMGGAVGLKGTDGAETLAEAVRRGARKTAGARAAAALKEVSSRGVEAVFLTCDGEMGSDAFEGSRLGCEVVCRHDERTSPEDTRGAAREFLRRGVDLIVFVGGDGTARDVLSEAGGKVPIIGVPSGVKMHSAVFVNTPSELADVIVSFSGARETMDAEVLDIDEESFRQGTVSARVFGVARVPYSSDHVQAGKQAYSSGTAEDEAEELAQYIADTMRDETTYIIGPGSTTARIAKALGQEKTLLGVDVYRGRVRARADASEECLLAELRGAGPAEVVVSPIGAQGFFFGRGNQQISAKVIRAVGCENVTVVSTPSKLKDTPVLRVDTGDPEVDEMFRGRLKVVTGYRRKRLVRVS